MKTVLFAGSERFLRESLRPREFSEHGVQTGGRDSRERSDEWIPLSPLQDSAHALITLAGGISVSGNPCVATSLAKGQDHHPRPSLDLQEARSFAKHACTCEMVLGPDEIPEVVTSQKRYLMSEDQTDGTALALCGLECLSGQCSSADVVAP
jgi:hypothetical protein